jgi:geranylgeranyl reductase family protein
MNMQKYDVAIVGGGPIGGFIAKKISSEGYKVVIFEEHLHIGQPLKCAGLISPKVFNILKISRNKIIQNEIKGANIHSPSGDILNIGGNKTHAIAIDRQIFDKEIINQAIKKNTHVLLKNKIVSLTKSSNLIDLKSSQKTYIKCKLLIGADGPYSIIRKFLKLPTPQEFLYGMGAEVKNTNLNPDFVEIFTGKNIAPGFFAWIIPTQKDGSEARIGLCASPNSPYSTKHYFNNFLKNKNVLSYLENTKITKKFAGAIPLGIIKKTYTSNALIVGDAAAQVKPTSGGGIYTGLLCAKHCSDVAVEALQKNNFSNSLLKKYHIQWMEDIGRELKLGMKLRIIFKNLNDRQLDKYIRKFQNPLIIDNISKFGDIDYPSKLIKPLLKKTPSLLKLIPNIIKK